MADLHCAVQRAAHRARFQMNRVDLLKVCSFEPQKERERKERKKEGKKETDREGERDR